MVGVELAGALKNVIAIAAGIVDGLGYGHNTVAALITRGLAEITRLAVALGGRAGHARRASPAWATWCSPAPARLSRNRRAGPGPGRGPTLARGARPGRTWWRRACARRSPPAPWPSGAGVEMPIARADAGGALRGQAAARGGRRADVAEPQKGVDSAPRDAWLRQSPAGADVPADLPGRRHPADVHLHRRRSGDRPLARLPGRAQGLRHLPQPRQDRGRTRTASASIDLKSKNGTQVNGVPVVEAPLKDGDRILLGKFQLTFSKSLEGKVVLDEAKPLSEEAGTIIRSVGELSKLPRRRGGAGLPAAPTAQEGAGDVQEIEKSNRILKVLTKVAETLIAVRPGRGGAAAGHGHRVRAHARRPRLPDARRRGRPDKLVPDGRQAPQRRRAATRARSPISKTIADRVMKDRVSILTSDAHGRPALRGRRLHPLPRHPQRHVRAALEQGRRSSGSSTWTRRCSPTASP